MTDNILSVGACFKCGKTSTAPCPDLDCPMLAADKLFRRQLMEEVDAIWRKDNHHRPMGCVCPPTSEQTCMNPLCPRQNHIGKAK